MAKFTWVDTYKEISQWLLSKEKEQPYLIKILKEVGVEVSNDINEHGERFELNEIDPFTFFAHLNKYKKDSKRIEILKNIHTKIGLKCEEPIDVMGIPTSHPLKVWLFPFKNIRFNNEIENLWELFRQVVEKKDSKFSFSKDFIHQKCWKGET